MVALTAVAIPTQGVKHTENKTDTYVDGKLLGKGTLCIAESAVVWVNEADGHGLSIEYRNISLHAVSRDNSIFPRPHLYLSLETNLTTGCGGGDGDEAEAGSDVKFVPDNTESLEAMYKNMATCQSLHPDSELSCDDDDWQYQDDDQENVNGNFVDVEALEADALEDDGVEMAENGVNGD